MKKREDYTTVTPDCRGRMPIQACSVRDGKVAISASLDNGQANYQIEPDQALGLAEVLIRLAREATGKGGQR